MNKIIFSTPVKKSNCHFDNLCTYNLLDLRLLSELQTWNICKIIIKVHYKITKFFFLIFIILFPRQEVLFVQEFLTHNI